MKKQTSKPRTVSKSKTTKRNTKASNRRKSSTWLSPNVLPLVVLGALVVVVAGGFIISRVASKKDNFVLVKGQYHHSASLGMSATFPKDWNINDKSADKSLITLLYASDGSADPSSTDPGDKDSSAITILKEPVDGNLDKASKEIFAQDNSDKALNKKVIKQADTEIGGLPAKMQEVTSDLGHEQDVITVDSNQVGYAFILYTPEAKWQSIQPVWQTLLHTVKFDK